MHGSRAIRNLRTKLFRAALSSDDGTNSTAARVCSLIEKLLWLIVIVAGVILSAWSCVDLYEDYQSIESASVKITPMNNESLRLPDATICLPTIVPLFSLAVYYGYIGDYYYPWPTMASNGATMAQLALTNLAVFLQQQQSWEEMRSVDWPYPVLYLAQEYLTVIYAALSETGFQPNQTTTYNFSSSSGIVLVAPFKNPAEMFAAKSVQDSDAVLPMLFQILVPKMQEWNVALAEFTAAFSRQFRARAIVQASVDRATGPRDVSNDVLGSDVVLVTRNQVCFKLKLSKATFSINQTDLQLSIDVGRLFLNPIHAVCNAAPPSTKVICYLATMLDVLNPLTIDLTGERKMGNTSTVQHMIYQSEWGKWKTIKISPVSQFVAAEHLQIGGQRCLTHSTRWQCLDDCRRKLIEAACGCTLDILNDPPTGLLMLSLESCRIGRLEQCYLTRTGKQQEEIEECNDRCPLDSCTQWRYDVAEDVEVVASVDRKVNYSQQTIAISLATLRYELIEEFNSWTFDNILGNIGGAFGFWLGLDIITVLDALLFGSIAIIYKCVCGNKRPMKEETAVANSNFECRADSTDHNYRFRTIFIQSFFSRYLRDGSKNGFVKWSIQKACYILLFLAGAILTIRSMASQLQIYNQMDTMTAVSLMRNQTLALPSVAICVPFYAGAGLLYDNGFSNDFYSTMSPSIVQTIHSTEFLSPNTTWSEAVLGSVVFYFLRTTFVLEQLDPNRRAPVMQRLPFILPNFTKFDDIFQAIHFLNANEEILKKMTVEFAMQHGTSMDCNVSGRITPVKPITVTMEEYPADLQDFMMNAIGIFPVSVCLHYNSETIALGQNNDECRLTDSTPPLIIGPYVFQALPFISISSRTTATAYEVSVLFGSNNGRVPVGLEYSSISESISNCSSTAEAPAKCSAACRRLTLAELCSNCTTVNQATDGNANCSYIDWKHTEDCLNAYLSSVKRQCDAKCNAQLPCSRAEIHFEQTGQQSTTDFDGLSLYFLDFSYPLYEERLSMTSSDLYASLGGLLGFWLGLDVSILLAIVVVPTTFLVEVCFAWCQKEPCIDPPSSAAASMKKKKKKLKESVGTMHFLAVIVKFFLEKLLWPVYVLFAILTVSMSIDLYHQIDSTPTQTSFSSLGSDNYSVPLTTFCVKLVIADWVTSVYDLLSQPGLDTAQTIDYYRDFGPVEAINDQHIIAFLNKPPVTKAELLAMNSVNDATGFFSYLAITHLYLSVINGLRDVSADSAVDNRYIFETDPVFNGTLLGRNMDIFGGIIAQLKMKPDDLLQKHGAQIIEIYEVMIVQQSANKDTIAKIVPERTKFLSREGICFELPLNTVVFTSPQDSVTFQVLKPIPVIISCAALLINQNPVIHRTNAITVDLLGRKSVRQMTDASAISVNYGNEQTTQLEVNSFIRQMEAVKGEQRCSDDVMASGDCIDHCQKQEIKHQCNCSWEEDTVEAGDPATAEIDNQICTWTSLKACYVRYYSDPAAECMRENCAQMTSCNRVRYSQRAITTFSTPDGFIQYVPDRPGMCVQQEQNASLTLSLASLRFPTYVEAEAWTFLSIVAAVGGIWGLWLGLNVVMLLDWFLWPGKAVIARKKLPRKPSSKVSSASFVPASSATNTTAAVDYDHEMTADEVAPPPKLVE